MPISNFILIDWNKSSKKANTTDTSTTIIGDLRALITKDTTASTVSDLENAFTLSVNNHLSSWGSYLYMSDTLEEGNEENETDQYALAKMTYADLISLIENNPGALSLFISTLPFAAKNLLDDYFTESNNGKDINQDFAAASLTNLSAYTNANPGDQVMLMLKAAGLVSFNDSALQDAKQQTFSDLNTTDVQNMLKDILAYSPHQLLWSVLDDTDLDKALSSDDAMHTFLTTQLFAGVSDVQDLIHMAIYNPAAFDQYMHNSIDGTTLASTVTTNINNLTQSDLQLYLNQFITHLATIDSNASTLFQHFATPFVADTYAMAIENHLAKLGAYLFAADPLNSNENRIDTIGELGTRLNTVSDL